ncbi:MAG: MFS transporter, partial [Candidatus Kapabacteria bacterium]|nr:MFS transporter [Candidatus Kapabacteria bacterium]
MSKIIQSNKKERLGWYIYDWANSAFSTTVITVFIGPYLSSIAANAADPDGNIFFFGIKIFSESLYPYLISLSVFLQLLLLPFIGAIADQYNIKKQLLGIFTGIGSVATIMLYYLSGSNYMFGSEMFL